MHAMFNRAISTLFEINFQYFLIEDIYYEFYSDSANTRVISIFVIQFYKKLVWNIHILLTYAIHYGDFIYLLIDNNLWKQLLVFSRMIIYINNEVIF